MSRYKALMFYADKLRKLDRLADAAALLLLAGENASNPSERIEAHRAATDIVDGLPEGEAVSVWARLYPDIGKLPLVQETIQAVRATLAEPPSPEPAAAAQPEQGPGEASPADAGTPDGSVAEARPPETSGDAPQSFASTEAFIAHQRATAAGT